jgi:cob(I)alamin adenosyltransferase
MLTSDVVAIKKQLKQMQEQLTAIQEALATLTKKPSKPVTITAEKLLMYIRHASFYEKDKQFAYFLRAGVMPRRKLQKLSKTNSAALDQLLRLLIDEQKIKEVDCMYPDKIHGERGYIAI